MLRHGHGSAGTCARLPHRAQCCKHMAPQPRLGPARVLLALMTKARALRSHNMPIGTVSYQAALQLMHPLPLLPALAQEGNNCVHELPASK